MLCIVVGTRPEIIKMSSIIRFAVASGRSYRVVHTGQHYSHAMDGVFFADLGLPPPDVNIAVGSGSHGDQTGRMLRDLEKIFAEVRPTAVLVQGDTNTVVAASLGATKLGIEVGHVEAGLRSYARSMPEEVNRIVADHISDYLFAPTQTAAENLAREGIDSSVFVTGNTIVDAVQDHLPRARRQSDVLHRLGLAKSGYLLLTAHRQENVDDEGRLRSILDGLDRVARKSGLGVIFPVHPRTVKRIEEMAVEVPEAVRMVDPVGYLDFLLLIENSALVLTDSGGIQEEACVLGVPLLTLRDNTERPEAIAVGSSILVGTDADRIEAGFDEMWGRTGWDNPFGDGTAGERIAELLVAAGCW